MNQSQMTLRSDAVHEGTATDRLKSKAVKITPVFRGPIAATRKTILILDDDESSVTGFQELLEMEGYEVVVTTSPFALPFLVGRHDPDLVLIDLSMPALSGATLLGELRSRVFKTHAALLLFSGRGADELARLCEELGAHDFISKGGELDVALDRIRFWVNYPFPTETNMTKDGQP